MQENCPQEPEKCFSECRAPTFVRPFYSAERSENPALHCARSQVASSFVFFVHTVLNAVLQTFPLSIAACRQDLFNSCS